jgi:transposase
LLEEGKTQAEVARALATSTASVSRWKQAYEQEGQTALSARPHPGRQPKLTAKQLERLAKLLLQGPGRHGYSTHLWTLSRVAEVILIRFGVSYDPSGVWHVLRRMGWSCQKPERRARERDEQAIATWRREDWPRIKKRSKKRP